MPMAIGSEALVIDVGGNDHPPRATSLRTSSGSIFFAAGPQTAFLP